MNHPTREEWIEYVYGQLGRDREASLKDHLDNCCQCRANIDSWRSVMDQLDVWQLPKEDKFAVKPGGATRKWWRWAAAAVLLVAVGYAGGRFLGHQELDMAQLHCSLEESLRASLEPTVRQNVIDDLNDQWRSALAANYAELKDELGRQYRRDLSEFAIRTLAASNVATNQLLTELIMAIDVAQTQDRQWIAAALGEIALNREHNTSLRYDLATFAVQTGDELQRTKHDILKLGNSDDTQGLVPAMPKEINKINERSKK